MILVQRCVGGAVRFLNLGHPGKALGNSRQQLCSGDVEGLVMK
jgi:hypothetical protein